MELRIDRAPVLFGDGVRSPLLFSKPSNVVDEGGVQFFKDTGEDGWLALEKCLSMTDYEWWFLAECTSAVDHWPPQEQWLVDMKEAVGERARRGIKAGPGCRCS